MSQPSSSPVNFRGRFEYLTAKQKHWPDLLATLPRGTCGPLRRDQRQLMAWPELGAIPELGSCVEALLKWARTHRVTDGWILDAAVQTMAYEDTGRWHYLAGEILVPKFAPEFGYWLPEGVSWKEFQNQTKRHFTEQLKLYR